MDEFFSHFTKLLKEKSGLNALPLKPARGADIERVLEHYRYQYHSKVSESISETFPVLKEKISDQWEKLLETYLHETLESPRSLNFAPMHFFEWLKTRSKLKTEDLELAAFEIEIDIFPWSHKFVESVSLNDLSEETSFELNSYKILNYSNDVYELYHERGSEGAVQLILWQNSEGVFFRKIADWQVHVLKRLSHGIGHALKGLEALPPEEIQNFFEWLASSKLLKHQR